MNMAERLERITAMKQTLKGVTFEAHVEPSHALTDRVMAMVDDQAISYVELTACTSREAEIQQQKKESTLLFNNDGLLKLSKQDKTITADVTGERKVKACMQRRALAFHLSGMCKYQTLDAFITRIFGLLDKPAPAGFQPVSIQQIIQADLALWQLVSQKTRGNVYAAGEPKPLDTAIADASESLDVLYYLLPTPGGTKRPSEAETTQTSSKKAKKQNHQAQSQKGGKGAGKGKSTKGKGGGISLPPGCAARNDNNENICFGYQSGKCKMRGTSVDVECIAAG